ncbi:MAG: alpha/beta hydrolase [Thiolinea sp.]
MKTVLVTGLIFILLVAVGVGCSTLKATDVLNFVLPTGQYVLKHATYGSQERQAMDVYLPKTTTDKPPIVFVYGGAWKEGDKADFAFVAHALTGLGYPVIIPDYRRYPQVRFPAFVDDVADAIRYAGQHAEELLGKPLREYILMGHSAGAHTVALRATDGHYLQARGVTARVVALVALAGPYDLTLDDPEVMPIFPNADPQAAKPVRNVHPGMPPVLLLHGADDERVSPKHTQRFAEALKQAGVPVEVRLYPGVDHVDVIGSLAAPLRMLAPSFEDIKAFLDATVGNSKQGKSGG